MKRWTVADVMRREVVTVVPGTGFQQIADVLVKHGVSAVPVVETDGRVLGVVSEADLLGKLEYSDRVPHHPLAARRLRGGRRVASGNTAADLMSAPAVMIHADATVSRAARLMDAARVKRLPVVDVNGVLIGIVARRDLVRLYARPDDVIQAAVAEDLAGLGVDVDGITIAVLRGVVTVSGIVDRRSSAAIVIGLTSAIPGVVDVVDELTFAIDDDGSVVQPYPPIPSPQSTSAPEPSSLP